MVLVMRPDVEAGTSMSKFVSASRIWSNSIPFIRLQPGRPGCCCYRYKVAICAIWTLEKTGLVWVRGKGSEASAWQGRLAILAMQQ
ncbi:MAG: hypothetical protein WA828_03320 [Coleofasciculaceae cyanobacterium]